MQNKSAYLFCILLLSFSGIASAQTAELGFGFHLLQQKGALLESFDPGTEYGALNFANPVKESYSSFGIQFVYNIPAYKVNDDLAFCMQPGAGVFAYYKESELGESDFIAGYQVPLYAAVRFGNGATVDSDKMMGVGAGAGAMLMGFEIPNESAMMISPALMAELKHRQWGLRFEYVINPYKSYYKSYTGAIPRLETKFLQLYITMNLSYQE